MTSDANSRPDSDKIVSLARDTTVALDGVTSSFVADGENVCVTTLGRSGRVARCVALAEVSAVDADARANGVLVSIVLADGHRVAVAVPASRSEEALQAATVLNLLAAEARRQKPVGIGVMAERHDERARRGASRRQTSS